MTLPRVAALAWVALISLPGLAQPRLSGNAFLTPQLLAMQQDVDANPVSLWVEKGRELWRDQCQGCHAQPQTLRDAATRYPKLSLKGEPPQLLNLEDQIRLCRQRSAHQSVPLEDDDSLSLSALLHALARGLPIQVQAPTQDVEAAQRWQEALARGATLYSTRMGHMNLACTHCHDQKVGAHLRAEVVSPGHPTGFPIYRLNWQTLGSIDRRLRACYSGVQAIVPPAGSAELRQLELYLMVRAQGMPLDGPSIRR